MVNGFEMKIMMKSHAIEINFKSFLGRLVSTS